jgi:transposase
MNAKRDRLFAAMAADGKTQEEIAEALEIPRRTVSDVLSRFGENGGAAKTARPLPEMPDLFSAEEDDKTDDAPEPEHICRLYLPIG